MNPAEDFVKKKIITIISIAYVKQSQRKKFIFLCLNFSHLSTCLLVFLESSSRIAIDISNTPLPFSFIWLALYVIPKQKGVNLLQEIEHWKNGQSSQDSRTAIIHAGALQTWLMRFCPKIGRVLHPFRRCFKDPGWSGWEAHGIRFRSQFCGYFRLKD